MNPINLAGLALSLSIPFGEGAPKPVTADFNIYGRQAMSQYASSPFFPGTVVGGTATPFGYRHVGDDPLLHREEMKHIEQMEALGILPFLLSYAATSGEPFEPYRARARDFDKNFDRMWMPPDEMRGQYPQFRATFPRDGESSPSLEFMPGQREQVQAVWELLKIIDEKGR